MFLPIADDRFLIDSACTSGVAYAFVLSPYPAIIHSVCMCSLAFVVFCKWGCVEVFMWRSNRRGAKKCLNRLKVKFTISADLANEGNQFHCRVLIDVLIAFWNPVCS